MVFFLFFSLVFQGQGIHVNIFLTRVSRYFYFMACDAINVVQNFNLGDLSYILSEWLIDTFYACTSVQIFLDEKYP